MAMEQMGLIYETLVQTSLLESTFILWTSDHGDGQGDHFHWRKGSVMASNDDHC